MNKNFKKIEIATMVSFTCVSYLSSFNLVHATQTFSEVCATDKNIITTQKVDVRKNNANNQTKTQSGIYFDNEELHSHNHKTIEGMANYLNKENALGIASTFHIFAQNTTLNVDTNGNVATDNLNSNVDFGTRGSDTEENSKINNSQCDINYINHISNIKPNSFRNKHNKVIMGSDINVSTNKDKRIVFNQKDGKSFYIEQGNLNLNETKTETKNNKYIDINSELDELSKKSDYWMDTNSQNSKGVKTYLEDENNRIIDLTDAEINKDNFIFVTIDANLLKNRPINIKGLGIKKNNKIPTVVINVKNTDKQLSIGTETKLYYRNANQPLPNSESHFEQNQLLWNFGTQIDSLSFDSGRFMGSVLAPKTKIFGNVNIDGNIIGKEVSISGGESHRWDLVTIANNSGQNQYPADFIEDSTLPENNDYPKNGNHKEAIPNNAPSYDLPELDIKEDKPHDAPSYDLPELDIKEDKPHNAPSYDLPEFEIKENESHNSSNNNYSEIDDKENYDSNDNGEINNPPLPPLDSSDLSNSTKETEDLKSQTNQTDDFIFYPPLAKHGQDINDVNILANKPQKNKICRSKINQKLVHRDIKKPRYLPISKINKAPSLVTQISNQSLKNTDYVNVPVTKKLPATSEKKINILNWIGIVIISGLCSLGIIKNRY